MGISEASAGGGDSVEIGRRGCGIRIKAREITEAKIIGKHNHDVESRTRLEWLGRHGGAGRLGGSGTTGDGEDHSTEEANPDETKRSR